MHGKEDKLSNESKQESNGKSLDSNHNSAQVNLHSNTNLANEVRRSIIVETWKHSSIWNVMEQLRLLGYDNTMIRSLSSKKFLVTFSSLEEFDSIELDRISLGFINCRYVDDDDLIVPRVVHCDCLGLPVFLWSKDNFSELIKNWGSLVGISPMINENFSFLSPILKIETQQWGLLEKTITFKFHDNNYRVNLRENDLKESNSMNFLDLETWEEMFVNPFNFKDKGNNSDGPEDDCDANPREDDVDALCQEGLNSEVENEVLPSPSLLDADHNQDILGTTNLNKCIDTARECIHENIQLKEADHKVKDNTMMCIQSDKWIPREVDNSSTISFDNTSIISISDKAETLTGVERDESSMSSIINKFAQVQVPKKRGRPKKLQNRMAKAFQLPKRSSRHSKVGKGGKLDITLGSGKEGFNKTSEAEQILETGLLMGLVTDQNKEEALRNISKRLN